MNISIQKLATGLCEGQVIPYLGPAVLSLCSDNTVPATPEVLAAFVTGRVSVPHKIRSRLTQAAQFIENFKHRKTVVSLLDEAFATPTTPSALHEALTASGTGLIVDTWYDDTCARALAKTHPLGDWVQFQGLSQSAHFGTWFGAYGPDGTQLEQIPPSGMVLYKPIGGHAPSSNYLVSDSDFVEVLTEIDIQTPIPPRVQAWRTGRSFLFIGCRFNDQLTRSFARQIMKRSSATHWAVLPDPPTRMEARFLEEQGIQRIEMPLVEFAATLVHVLQPALAT